jgi:hypothetical protein
MWSLKFHLFNLYTWELNFGQTIWDKTQVLLETSWGTLWELDGNTLRTKGKKKNLFPPIPSKEKNLRVHDKPFPLKFLFSKHSWFLMYIYVIYIHIHT